MDPMRSPPSTPSCAPTSRARPRASASPASRRIDAPMVAFTLNGAPRWRWRSRTARRCCTRCADRSACPGRASAAASEQCGACVVLVDGAPAYACTLRAAAVAGRARDDRRRPRHAGRAARLQRAFLDEQAGQCGYCLSGILVASAALLAREPGPDDAAIRAALDPHLCRCGSHNRIIRAVKRAAAGDARAGPRRMTSGLDRRAAPPGKLPGNLRRQPAPRPLAQLRRRRPRHRHARQGRTRPGHPDRAGADRGGGTRRRAAAHRGCARGHHGRQPE